MAEEAEAYVWRLVGRVQKSKALRNVVAAAVVLGLLGLTGRFIYDLLPRHYDLTITGGDLLGNRHYLAKVLQQQARAYGVALKIIPTPGSEAALDAVDDGKLDLAFIQGGLDAHEENILHVATLPPELIHFLVKPSIHEVKDIKGRIVNLGEPSGGTRVVSHEILRYSGLLHEIDYTETNFSNETLLAMQPERLPDVIVVISYAPSAVADFLVKERGYRLLEMPFPPSLATRLGWVADAKILGYMYSIDPPVPPKDVHVVGVNLHLVANKRVDPRAIERVLEALYTPQLAAKFREKPNEADILVPSGYPVSAGTEMFMARNDPFLPVALIDKIKAGFGLLMSLASTMLIGYRWYRAEEKPPPPEKHDKAYQGFLGEIAGVHNDLEQAIGEGAADGALITGLLERLSAIKHRAVELAETANLDNPSLIGTVMLCISDTRAELLAAMAMPPAAATTRFGANADRDPELMTGDAAGNPD